MKPTAAESTGRAFSHAVREQATGLLQNQWLWFVIKRLAALVLVLLALIVVVFFMLHLVPGNPALAIAGPQATPQVVARVNQELGLNRPILAQLWSYFVGVLHGDLGKSYVTSQPVGQLLTQRAGQSLLLASAALGIVLLLGFPIGIAAAALTRESRHPRGEVGFVAVSSVVGSLPEYLTATVLVFAFALKLRWFPVSGTTGFSSLILPVIAVSLAPLAIVARIVRVSTLEVLSQDYIRTVRSQRLPTRVIYFHHVFPNVLAAALTIGGIIFAGIIGGAVIVENVFDRAGLGTALVNAVEAKDYPVVQGVTLLIGAAVVVVNAVVEMLLALINPRVMRRNR